MLFVLALQSDPLELPRLTQDLGQLANEQHAQGRKDHPQDQGQGHRWQEEERHAPPPTSSPAQWLSTIIDPNAPKRGLSAYMFFANEQRDTVREENPGITFGTKYFPHHQSPH